MLYLDFNITVPKIDSIEINLIISISRKVKSKKVVWHEALPSCNWQLADDWGQEVGTPSTRHMFICFGHTCTGHVWKGDAEGILGITEDTPTKVDDADDMKIWLKLAIKAHDFF